MFCYEHASVVRLVQVALVDELIAPGPQIHVLLTPPALAILSELSSRVFQTDFDEFIEVYEAINHELWHLYGLKQTTKEEK